MTDDTTNAGGVGGLRNPAKRWEQRQHLRVLEQAVYQGWEIPETAYATIPIDLLHIAQDQDASHRDRIRATEALMHLAGQRMDAAVQYDRIKRLDADMATDRVEISSSVSDSQLAAVAAALYANPPCPAKAKRKRR